MRPRPRSSDATYAEDTFLPPPQQRPRLIAVLAGVLALERLARDRREDAAGVHERLEARDLVSHSSSRVPGGSAECAERQERNGDHEQGPHAGRRATDVRSTGSRQN